MPPRGPNLPLRSSVQRSPLHPRLARNDAELVPGCRFADDFERDLRGPQSLRVHLPFNRFERFMFGQCEDGYAHRVELGFGWRLL